MKTTGNERRLNRKKFAQIKRDTLRAVKTRVFGIEVTVDELEGYARTGKLPFKVISASGLLWPGFDPEIADYHVREGMERGRLTWGIFRRADGARIASFLPGYPRSVATIKDLYDACYENRKFKTGRFEDLSPEHTRKETQCETQSLRSLSGK